MKKVMTKEEFKARWESDENGSGITFNDIADCAVAWYVNLSPRTSPISNVRYQVLKAAQTVDAEDFNPANGEDEDEI